MSDQYSLQALIRKTIPLSEFMQFEISSLGSSSITTSAPLNPNVNIHGTGFAGSLYSLSMLTAWAFVMHCLQSHNITAELVAARAEIQYRKPVKNAIECQTHVASEDIDNFIQQLQKRGRAKMEVIVDVGNSAATLNALMVAICHE